MDELAQVRFELEQLERKERDLDEELSRLRVAIGAHKSRIEHLAWVKAPIKILPTEVLSYVLELILTDHLYEHYISSLAKVSRAWKHIILNSTKFWGHIHLLPRQKMSLVKERVARSCRSPLDISISLWEANDVELSSFIDVVVPHVHRWRSLDICQNNHRSLQLILDKINHLKFPSLIRASIRIHHTRDMEYPPFLRSDNAPSLTSICLDDLGPMALPPSLSSQHLTTLALTYSGRPSLQTDSISLPFLTSLTLRAKHPKELLLAIVPLNLLYFHLTVEEPGDEQRTLFHGLKSKFRSVQHLKLHIEDDFVSDVECATSISSTFPNVRQVELCTAEVNDFFRLGSDGSRPADHWRWLEFLTFDQMEIRSVSSIEHFVRWLREEDSKGLPMLPVKFIDCVFLPTYIGNDESYYSSPSSLSRIHRILREICILDMVDVEVRAMTSISLTSAPPPPLVCIATIVERVI